MIEQSNKNKRILYVRSGPYEVRFDSYNLQEVGLGTAFCKQGYDFDLIYYAKENRDQVLDIGEKKLTIFWRKGIKLLRTGIYPFLLKRDFLAQYDIVIVSEYSQIMSYLIGKRHNNVYLYNGPYYNLFKLPFIEPIYDKLFCKKINKEMKKVFCKTKMAADYIGKKGITNTIVTGVGLDTSKFENETEILHETKSLLNNMSGKRNLLYVGSISHRKNVALLINAFVELRSLDKYKDVQLILIGKGDTSYTQKCKEIIPENLNDDIIWCEFIKNAQLKFIYKKADVFLLPSIQEIFGMVLLEAMYFGLPTISSHSAGADTLINNKQNGIIIDNFNVNKWVENISFILDNPILAKKYGDEASKTIRSEYLWDKIAGKMLDVIEW